MEKWNNKRYYFDREYLHQFIIFSTHAGTRVGETLNIKWKDVKFNHHKQKNKCNLKFDNNSQESMEKSKSVNKLSDLVVMRLGVVVFIPPQCGVELRLWGGKTPHTKTGGVEFSTPKLHHCGVEFGLNLGSVGWSGVECLFQ